MDRQRGSLLLVEDYDDVRTILRLLLQCDHYRVLEAATGMEALNILKTESPDLILMDLGLPELDGFETIRRIRQNEAFQDTPIIVLTAFTGPFYYQAALRAGGNYFMGKPVDFEALEELIHNILQGNMTTKRRRRSSTTDASLPLLNNSCSHGSKERRINH